MEDIVMSFISIARCASQLKDDVDHMYGRENRIIIGDPHFAPFKRWAGWTGCPENGQVMLIATRSKQAIAEFTRKMAIHHAIEKKQTLVMFSHEKSYRYLKELVDDLADVPKETAIYDGGLDADELRRVRSALTYLNQSSLYIGSTRLCDLETACAEAHGLIKSRGKVGAILIDNLWGFVDWRRTMIEPATVLVRFRTLARDLNVPVIALYPLQQEEVRPLTLTRQELQEAEYLSKLVDSMLLLGSENDGLRFARPKISSYRG